MTTALKLGPADHGRALTPGEFYASELLPGGTYELVRGHLAVSPFPELAQTDVLDNLLQEPLRRRYPWRNGVVETHNKAWVYGPSDQGPTLLRPDLALYRGVPTRLSERRNLNWCDISPFIVAEVTDPGYEDKDLVRNPELYLDIPSVGEYWVVESQPNPYQPSLIVHRRHGRGWCIIDIPYGDTYTTPLLPGFALPLHFDQE